MKTNIKKKKDNITEKVISIKTSKGFTPADVKALTDKVIANPGIVDDRVKQAAEDVTANYIKAAISSQEPEYYKYFKDLNYKQLMEKVDMNNIKGNNATDMLTLNFDVQAADGSSVTPTSFSISPNSFWANVTNILNEVSVGNNYIDTGKSFNAWNFFRSDNLASGEAALRTIGSTLSGICLLNQNSLVPNSTQMLKGYQASLGVFINVDSASAVGGGIGLGMFTMYSTPINVLKLAVTNPQQFSDMVRIFQATAINSREYSLWVITTNNMLNNITNVIVDNYNTNVRNCLNGTLFPAINIMKNPTNEFNCGLIVTQGLVGEYSTNNNQLVQIGYNTNNFNESYMNQLTWTLRNTVLNTSYINGEYTGNPTAPTTPPDLNFMSTYTSCETLVPGSEQEPRIQVSSTDEIYLIVSPEFLAGFKSGTLSQLFHWEFQRLEEYVKPENIFMLYKNIDIPAAEMNTTVVNDNNQSGYPFNVRATLGGRWLPKNAICLITKPKDINMWTANYGSVWTTDMSNTWGAGMISTSYLQYAIYGGVLPWANGCMFYFKNLLNLVSDSTQAIFTDFTIGTLAYQKTATSDAGSGND